MGIIRLKNFPIVESANLGAVLGNTVDIWTKELPVRTKMRIKKFGNDLTVGANWGFVRWDFIVNGQLVPGMSHIYDQMGFQAGRQECKEVVVPGGSSIIVRATNGSAAGVVAPGGACAVSISLAYDLEDEE
jgi:hypothetical protein